MKLVTIIILGVLILSFIFVVGFYNDVKEVETMEEQGTLFQGPVRPTDDEEHFRNTGETKPKEINE